ncbi:MAG: glutamine-hydrolyzing GMP synthase [Flavobacteriales bacterium]|nr:glutamine-hydrolyzing GMP synthase [Flavobacteriales bacterium]
MDSILILDFGSQYTQLIARRVRELNTYAEIKPWNGNWRSLLDTAPADDALGRVWKGVILSGSPHSVREDNAPAPDLEGVRGRWPVLGVCFGAQWLAQDSGGRVEASDSREYGRAHLNHIDTSDRLFEGMTEGKQVWMSHGDTIQSVGDKARVTCSTHDVTFAGFSFQEEPTWGIQFHPEVYHSEEGLMLLRNYVHGICGCAADWTPAHFVDSTVEELKEQLGEDRVVLGLSGGVDSSVAAMLLHRAIGDRLFCIFVDNGLLRKHEFEEVMKGYEGLGLNVKGVRAADRFYEALSGVSDPEGKRKAIGATFIDVFDHESGLLDGVKWLGQGTIYPDVIESVSATGGPSATIKSHHNVGGLPDYMKLQVVEPLRMLFKDEVRRVGREMGMSQELLGRHPFPGPGLGIRILGEVTPEKVDLLQNADRIWTDKLREHGHYDRVWQAGTILLPVQSVGVMGDERTYEQAVALRAVTSTDGMTADWVDFPHAFLAEVSNAIINKVRGINRVVYDISSKPPATIEWE